MKKKETVELEIDDETITKLNEMCLEYNCSINDIFEDALVNHLSKKTSISDISAFDEEDFKSYWTVENSSGIAIARISPL